jgi:hypothetical protein
MEASRLEENAVSTFGTVRSKREFLPTYNPAVCLCGSSALPFKR